MAKATLTLTAVKEYIWAKYVENEDVPEDLDEEDILAFFEDHYRENRVEDDPEPFYFGILMFEMAWDHADRKKEFFYLARQLFRMYRDVSGETDWETVEDRLADIDDYFQGEGIDLDSLKGTYALPHPAAQAPETVEEDALKALRDACPAGMILVPASKVSVRGRSDPVEVPAFFIDRFPVTNAEYRRFLETTKYREPKYLDDEKFGAPDKPVVGVSLMDAEKYAEWSGKKIPTHEQWLAAARGSDSRPYPWGAEKEPARLNCLYPGEEPDLEAVGKHPDGVSEAGVEDLLGGAWEWTDTWFDDKQEYKIIKGGSFVDPLDYISIDTVLYASPKEKIDNVGFRCCRPVIGAR